MVGASGSEPREVGNFTQLERHQKPQAVYGIFPINGNSRLATAIVCAWKRKRRDILLSSTTFYIHIIKKSQVGIKKERQHKTIGYNPLILYA